MITMISSGKTIIEHEATGFGINIEGATSSQEALEMAGLDWEVGAKKTFYMDAENNFIEVPNVFQNVRREDGKSLGTVTGRYKICQNHDAFGFTDELLGSGVKYKRAGAFHGGRSVWISAEMPEDKIILGDPVKQELIFLNSHDGTGAVRVLIAPRRIVCSNALNLFIKNASRKWACVHTGQIQYKMDEAKQTLLRTDKYMAELEKTCEELQKTKITEGDVNSLIEKLIPIAPDANNVAARHAMEKRAGFADVYFNKPDLALFGNTAYRFVNAASDFITHSDPARHTSNYKENLFEKTINGHPFIDRAFAMVA